MSDFWLREATIRFEEVLRRDTEGGRLAARERLGVLRDAYLALREAGLDRPLAELGSGRDEGRGTRDEKDPAPSSLIPHPSSLERSDRQVARNKGAWVIWMVRQAVGPLSFHEIWSAPEGPPETIEALKGRLSALGSQFPAAGCHISGPEPRAESREPEAWSGFFDFWVYSTGLPQYRLLSATMKGSAGEYTVTLKIANRGTGTIPAPLVIQTEEGARHEFSLAVPGGETREVRYSLVTKPVAAAVDPEGDLLQPEASGEWQAVKSRRWF